MIQARKSIPIDRLEHLRSQLSSSTHQGLSSQLEEVLTKLEPPDSASSSRRSSISSHVSRRLVKINPVTNGYSSATNRHIPLERLLLRINSGIKLRFDYCVPHSEHVLYVQYMVTSTHQL